MSTHNNPFANIPLEHAIALRWSLRDIHARRLKITPLDPTHLDVLRELGLVVLNDAQQPELTDAGRDVILD